MADEPLTREDVATLRRRIEQIDAWLASIERKGWLRLLDFIDATDVRIVELETALVTYGRCLTGCNRRSIRRKNEICDCGLEALLKKDGRDG